MKTDTLILIKAMRRLADDIQSDDGVANAAIAEAADRLAELERENAALKQRILDDNKAYGCELMDPSGTIWDHAKRLQQENAVLRKMLSDADELERYSGSDGHRQWGKCSAWLHPDDAVVIISAKALDAYRKEAQP